MAENKKYNTTINIAGTLQYANVFEPRGMEGDENSEKKYSATIIIPKTDKATLQKIVNAMEEAKQKAIDNNITTRQKLVNAHNPLRDGDVEKPEKPEFKNSFFINAKVSEANPPEVLVKDEVLGVLKKAEKHEIYNGCYAAINATFFVYAKMSVGVSLILNKVLKLKDGEPLSVQVKAEDAFGEFLDNEAATWTTNDVKKEEIAEEERTKKFVDDLPF